MTKIIFKKQWKTGKIKMKSIKIGLKGVYSGKTSFIQRYINGDFADNAFGSAVGWDISKKNITLLNCNYLIYQDMKDIKVLLLNS